MIFTFASVAAASTHNNAEKKKDLSCQTLSLAAVPLFLSFHLVMRSRKKTVKGKRSSFIIFLRLSLSFNFSSQSFFYLIRMENGITRPTWKRKG
jgi:hypothetical protein